MKTKRKIIIDVDTGVDDALALLLAAKQFPDEVIGVTTCGGNISLELATQNTLAILDLAKVRWPVFKGANKNLSNEDFVHAYDYHGENGLGNIKLQSTRAAEKRPAIDFIIDSANRHAGNLVFVCLAPATNLASALIKNPEIKKAFSRVVMMGGAVNVPGNQSEYAEFNFFQDPLAVKTVFRYIKNIQIVPLDVTHKCLIGKAETVSFGNNSAGRFVSQLVKNWYCYFGDKNNRQFELYDPLALAALNQDLLDFKIGKFDVVLEGPNKGALNLGQKEIFYASSVKALEFKKFLINF
jgi:purine nucleosidase